MIVWGTPSVPQIYGPGIGGWKEQMDFYCAGTLWGDCAEPTLRSKSSSVSWTVLLWPSFIKGCAQITPERQRVLVKVFPSYDYIFQDSEEKLQLISRSQVKRFQNHSSLKNRPANFFQECIYIQYRSKVWTHFFSFFKTAVEIRPVG